MVFTEISLGWCVICTRSLRQFLPGQPSCAVPPSAEEKKLTKAACAFTPLYGAEPLPGAASGLLTHELCAFQRRLRVLWIRDLFFHVCMQDVLSSISWPMPTPAEPF